MNKNYLFLLLLISLHKLSSQNTFTIAFGSCNKASSENLLWDDVLKTNPNVWIWGGDNIYGDTNDMKKMKNIYELQSQQKGYSKIKQNIPILGTWDDHDYGKNDAGEEYEMKKESQQLFLDFLNVDKLDKRREREGVYHATTFDTKKGSVKVIVLDTRYHRSKLTRVPNGPKKYIPNTYENETMLGKTQWEWFTKELTQSTADFNIVVSSIQVLSSEHRFEKWANFPTETNKLLELIQTSKANNIIFLSGDRHISEFSKTKLNGISYPVIDFTSSGLTHAYKGFTSEKNRYRNGNVVFTESFGVLKFDFDRKRVIFQMRGDNEKVLQEMTQVYP